MFSHMKTVVAISSENPRITLRKSSNLLESLEKSSWETFVKFLADFRTILSSVTVSLANNKLFTNRVSLCRFKLGLYDRPHGLLEADSHAVVCRYEYNV